MPRVVVIIPARWASSRFPGKIMHPICGMPLVLRTFGIAEMHERYIAVDSDDVKRELEDSWSVTPGQILLTPSSCRNGTERCAVAANLLELAPDDVVINLQADACLVPPDLLGGLASAADELLENRYACLTVARHADHWEDGGVAVRLNRFAEATAFERLGRTDWTRGTKYHVGLYAYRVTFLRRYFHWLPDRDEERHGLEQLRWLAHGKNVRCMIYYPKHGPLVEVNAPSDVHLVETLLHARAG